MKNNIGIRALHIDDKENDIAFRTFVMYPGSKATEKINIGPYPVHATYEAPADNKRYPLVIISHGNGGTPLGYLTISEYLTGHGFIVAMPEHYGNNYKDNSLDGSNDNLRMRPRHISLVINTLLDDPGLKDHIKIGKTAVIGHSMGGYTALAAAGGRPWSIHSEKIELIPDARIKALVLLAPATEWFTPQGSLDDISIPILMLTAEHDFPLPDGWHKKTADIVINQLDGKNAIKFRIIENSGHFSFMSPFPEAMRNSDFLPSTDPEGFDREKFHHNLKQEILAFLDSVL